MGGTSQTAASILRPQILERRQRLQAAASVVSGAYLSSLLEEVDAALKSIDEGNYGLCEVCHDPIETERLLADPLVRVCLDHLSDAERRAHEGDLELAAQIQAKLLPPRALEVGGWETHYHYVAAGPVGGDYCEVVTQGDSRPFFFAVGDVAGKGIAASLLMTHLSATLRSLLSLSLPMPEVMSRANRLFCEGTLASHYATLVCGRVAEDHGLEICNAGHCPALLVEGGAIRRLESSGLPLGMFCQGEYPAAKVNVAAGGSLVLYTDGITEARDPDGNEYGESRLADVLRRHSGHDAEGLTKAVLEDVSRFRREARAADDITVLVVRRLP